jgi:hypothetical protein
VSSRHTVPALATALTKPPHGVSYSGVEFRITRRGAWVPAEQGGFIKTGISSELGAVRVRPAAGAEAEVPPSLIQISELPQHALRCFLCRLCLSRAADKTVFQLGMALPMCLFLFVVRVSRRPTSVTTTKNTGRKTTIRQNLLNYKESMGLR